MKTIASNLKENKKDLILVIAIQTMLAFGCYLMIPKILG